MTIMNTKTIALRQPRILTGYPSSEEILQRLCGTHSDRPVELGLLKTVGAAGLGFLTVLSGFGIMLNNSNLLHSRSQFQFGFNLGWDLMLGIAGFLSARKSLALLRDGLSSVGKPFGLVSRDGTFYYRNGSFIDRPTSSDKKHGTRIIPIDDVNRLNTSSNNFVLINPVVIKNATLTTSTKSKTKWVYNVAFKTYMPSINPELTTQYTVVAEGEFQGRPIRLSTMTEDSKLAWSLSDRKAGDTVYVMGRLTSPYELQVQFVGTAFRNNVIPFPG